MRLQRLARGSLAAALCMAAAAACVATPAWAQGAWRPDKAVEIIVPTGAGGAKGLTAAQAAFWEEALAKVVATSEWKQQLDSNNLESKFLRGGELARWLDGEYNTTKAVLADMGLAK